MDTKMYERFANLDAMRKHHEAKIKEIREEMVELEKQLIEASLEENIDKVTVIVGHTEDGLPVKRTVYRQRKLWAGHQGDPEALNIALKESGLHEYVTEKANTNSLSAYIRGFDPDRIKSPEDIIAELPAPLQPVIKVTEAMKMISTVG